jgi:hypothetical protein
MLDEQQYIGYLSFSPPFAQGLLPSPNLSEFYPANPTNTYLVHHPKYQAYLLLRKYS